MSLSTLAIPLAFIILSVLLLWFVIETKGKWFAKIFSISLTLLFTLVTWNSVDSYMGWPCKADLPKKFLVCWAVIDEPKSTSDGAIYLWVQKLKTKQADVKEATNYLDILKYQDNLSEPRCHTLPYSQDMHQQIQKMLAAMKKGGMFIGDGETIKEQMSGKGKGKGSKYGKKGKGGNGSGSFSNSKIEYFGELPPTILPDKVR